MGVTCATLDGSHKTAHDQVKLLLAREGREAGLQVEVEVFGAFTRALREADMRRADSRGSVVDFVSIGASSRAPEMSLGSP